MKNQLKKKLKLLNLSLSSQKIIKQPLKLLNKINLKEFGKVTKNSLTKTYINFKKKTKVK